MVKARKDPSQPGLVTSRRNFVAGAALLGSTIALSFLGSSSAKAEARRKKTA